MAGVLKPVLLQSKICQRAKRGWRGWAQQQINCSFRLFGRNLRKGKGGIYIFGIKKQAVWFAVFSLLLFGALASKASAYKMDAKAVIMGPERYVAWYKEHDPTYAQGTMQTVTVDADGQEYAATFHGDKVKDALHIFGIDLEDMDSVNLDPERPLEDGDRIVVKSESGDGQRAYVRKTPLLKNGQWRVIFANRRNDPGRKVFDFDESVDVDAKLLQALAEKNGLLNCRYVWVYVGSDGSPLSVIKKGFEGIELDQNNKPVKYLRKLDNANVVAYSTNSRRSWGASGMTLAPGYVAVNTNRFKYGTKFFIVSKDGKFIYGNAVAADTGTSLAAGTCDFDVIIDSYEESCWFGRKFLEVYVLEEP